MRRCDTSAAAISSCAAREGSTFRALAAAFRFANLQIRFSSPIAKTKRLVHRSCRAELPPATAIASVAVIRLTSRFASHRVASPSALFGQTAFPCRSVRRSVRRAGAFRVASAELTTCVSRSRYGTLLTLSAQLTATLSRSSTHAALHLLGEGIRNGAAKTKPRRYAPIYVDICSAPDSRFV